MGLPTVLLVALLAVGGMWLTFAAPDRTGQLAASAGELAIPRGCMIVGASGPIDPCDPPAFADAQSSAPSGGTSVCRVSKAQWTLEVLDFADGNRGVRWSVPTVWDPAHPISTSWLIAWPVAGSPTLVNGPERGFAFLGSAAPDETLQVLVGSIAAGGSLDGGLQTIAAIPFAPTADGVRLAVGVNDGELAMEVPFGAPHTVERLQEALTFVQWTGARLTCDA